MSIEESFPIAYVDARTTKLNICELFLMVPFPARPQKLFWECLGGMAVPTRKARLVGLLLALTRQTASALLELSSPTSTSWRGLCWQPDWASYWLSAHALAPWDCTWSLHGHGLNFAASSTLGSSKRSFSVNDWRAAIPWLVLGGPWKACLRLHKIGRSPTRRFLKKTPQLVGILVLKTTTPQLVGVHVEPL